MIQVKTPAYAGREGTKEAYRHYAEILSDGDVFVKVDDDILSFLGFARFVGYLRCAGPRDVVFPNTINNDVALPFQLIEGMLGSDAEDCVLRALPRTQDG